MVQIRVEMVFENGWRQTTFRTWVLRPSFLGAAVVFLGVVVDGIRTDRRPFFLIVLVGMLLLLNKPIFDPDFVVLTPSFSDRHRSIEYVSRVLLGYRVSENSGRDRPLIESF